MRLILSIACLLLLSGCLCDLTKGHEAVKTTYSETMAPATILDVATTSLPENPNGSKKDDKPSDFFELLDSGLPYACHYETRMSTLDIMIGEGKYYARLKTRQAPLKNYLNDGEWEYVWNENANTGKKHSISGTRGLTGEVDKEMLNSQRTAVMNTEVLYVIRHAISGNCSSATHPPDIFKPPRLQYKVSTWKIVEPR